MDKPLQGCKVIDLTHVLAGPYCTYQLGLLGADVVKVESPKGDMVRGWGGTREQLDAKLGTGFIAQNAGKKSIALDIKSEQGADIVRQLVRDADVFVENFRPGSMAKHGLDYERLRQINPTLIYVSISAFGQNGPHGHRPGFDDVVQATSGFMSINQRGDGPIRTGGPVLDYATGMHATAAVLAAVLLRNATGEGQHIDLAMQDVTMLLINRNTSITASTGTPVPPAGDREAPMLGRFATRNGYVMLAGYLPHHCRALCAAMGLEAFANASGRELAERADELGAAVEGALLEKTSEEWDDIFGRAGVVGGGVRDLAQVIATGQPEARQLLTQTTTAAGEATVTTAGYRINGEVFAPSAGVPSLGGHTREVLAELGYDDDEIARLLASGVARDSNRN